MSEHFHVPEECECCKSWTEQLQKADTDLKNAEKDLRGKRSQIAKLKADPNRFKDHPDIFAAKEVFDYYVKRFNKNARFAFDVKRQEVLIQALMTHTVHELKQAIEGAYLEPWVGRNGREVTELATLLKDAPAIDRRIEAWKAHNGQATDFLPPRSARARLAAKEGAQRPSGPSWPELGFEIDTLALDARVHTPIDALPEPQELFGLEEFCELTFARPYRDTSYFATDCPACLGEGDLRGKTMFVCPYLDSFYLLHFCDCSLSPEYVTRAVLLRRAQRRLDDLKADLQTLGPIKEGKTADAGLERVA